MIAGTVAAALGADLQQAVPEAAGPLPGALR